MTRKINLSTKFVIEICSFAPSRGHSRNTCGARIKNKDGIKMATQQKQCSRHTKLLSRRCSASLPDLFVLLLGDRKHCRPPSSRQSSRRPPRRRSPAAAALRRSSFTTRRLARAVASSPITTARDILQPRWAPLPSRRPALEVQKKILSGGVGRGGGGDKE